MMSRHRCRRAALLLLTLGVLACFIPLPGHADSSDDANGHMVPSQPLFFQVQRDILVTDAGMRQVIGLLYRGTVFRGQQTDGETLYFQWGNATGSIPLTEVVFVAENEPEDISWQAWDSTLTRGFLQVRANTEALDPATGNPAAVLQEGTVYPYVGKQDAVYQIILGERMLNIPQDDRVSELPPDYRAEPAPGPLPETHETPAPRHVVNPRQVYTYEQMEQDLALLEAMYPHLIETRVIGQSVDGRHLYAVKLGNGPTEILLNASHHAREHITTNLVMNMLDKYAYAAHTGQQIGHYNMRKALELASIWFIPMVNPDGVTLVQKGHLSANDPQRVIALNGNNPDFSAWKANIRGVDLNRQYPALWTTITHDPGKPGPQNYKGPKPLSEPEAQALYRFAKNLNLQAAISYHASGELIYTRLDVEPYSRPLAQSVASLTGYQVLNIKNRQSGGGFTDWFILNMKKPALTPEIAPYAGPRPVPLEYWDRIWKQNEAVGITVAMKAYQWSKQNAERR